MASQPLTEYERRRLKNIKRNEEMMSSLKLQSVTNELYSSSKRHRTETKGCNKITREKKPKSDQNPILIRRSLRNPNQKPTIEPKESSPVKLGPISMGDAYIRSTSDQQHLIHTIKDMSDKTTFRLRGSTKRQEQQLNNRDYGAAAGGSLLDLSSLILKPENIARLLKGKIMDLQFFPCNARSMIVGGNKFGNLAFWDVDLNDREDEGLYLYGPHTGPISGITIQPFSLSKVATSSYDGTIRLMDIKKESFDLVYSSDDAIFCLSQRPNDAKSLYFGEVHGKINVWDTRAGKSSSSWILHDQRINTIDFNPANTNLMATCSTDGNACIWDLRSIKANRPKAFKMFDHKMAVHSAYFSPSGSCLATTSAGNKVLLLSGADFTGISMIDQDNETGSFFSIRAIWGWDDSYLFACSMKREVDVISTSYRKTVTLESPHISAIPCQFAVHPYKVGMLAGATSGGQVYTWISQQEL